jgi:hypothetical protein
MPPLFSPRPTTHSMDWIHVVAGDSRVCWALCAYLVILFYALLCKNIGSGGFGVPPRRRVAKSWQFVILRWLWRFSLWAEQRVPERPMLRCPFSCAIYQIVLFCRWCVFLHSSYRLCQILACFSCCCEGITIRKALLIPQKKIPKRTLSWSI